METVFELLAAEILNGEQDNTTLSRNLVKSLTYIIPLSPVHYKELAVNSHIPLRVIIDEGYCTITNNQLLNGMGFSWKQQTRIDESNPALLMPIRSPSGETVAHMFKPRNPRIIFSEDKTDIDPETGGKIKHEKAIKYEFPKGATKRLHVPLKSLPNIQKAEIPCLITEGHKKASCATQLADCVVMVDGVFAWRNERGVLADWEGVAIKGRHFVLAFDSDAWTNNMVKAALNRLGDWLMSRGADKVSRLVLPTVNNDPKTGIDDWMAFAVQNDRAEFWRLVVQSDAQTEQKEQRANNSEQYIKLLYDKYGLRFQLNSVTNCLECNKKPMDDFLRYQIRTKLRDDGYGGLMLMAIEEAWHSQAKEDEYHPIADYLNNQKWDGRDHIAKLAEYFHETDDHEAVMVEYDVSGRGPFQLWLKKWLVGAVARAIHHEPVRNAMLVLDGGQHIGKSTFCRWLTGGLPEYFVDDEINPEDKDHKIMLATKFIWEVGELGAVTRRKDRESLKAFLTKQIVDERAAYGRYKTRQKAIVSFIGTINDESGFLNDPTGSTRFMVCSIESLDWNYSKDMDANQLWAQAVQLYRSGYDWRLNSTERELQARVNSHYQIDNPMAHEILAKFEIDPDSNTFMSTRDIMIALEKDPTNIALAMKMGSALKHDFKLKKVRLRDPKEMDLWERKGKAAGKPRPQPVPGYMGLLRRNGNDE